MHAMRRHAHNFLAALLCMCLLISYTPLPASAAEGDYSPSVSDELGEATSIGDGKAQMSTTVSVLTIPALAITSQTEDYAAKIDEIKADADKYDLKVAVTGQEPFTYAWSRDDGLSISENSATYPLSQHTDTLQDGKTYVYTVVVKDKSGEEVSASIKVTVSSAYSEKTFKDDEKGISVTASAHYDAQLSTGIVANGTETFSALQQAASEKSSGASISGAWTVGLGTTDPGPEPFVGKASVTLPAADIPEGAEIFVVGLDGTGKTTIYQPTVESGKATFDTSALGAFAVTYKVPEKPTYTITPSVEGIGGKIDPFEPVEVSEGDSATFTFRPDDTYVVDTVKIDGNPVDASEIVGNSYKFENVVKSQSISVSFKKVEPKPTQHTVSASVVSGKGMVKVEGSASGATAHAQVQEGSPAVVSFLPDNGWIVDTVTMKVGDGEATTVQPTSLNELSISAVTGPTEVTVSYKSGSQPPVQMHTVTATAGEGGTIQPGSAEVPHGSSTSFVVKADPGYQLKTLTIDGDEAMDKLDGTTLKVPNVIKDSAVHATFELVPAANHTVEASVAGDGGAISPAGEQTVAAGSSLTFYVHPDEGYVLESLMLSENGGTAQNVADRVIGGVFVLDNIRADTVLTASFEDSGIVVPDDTFYAINASAGDGGAISPAGSVRVKAGGSQTFHFLPDAGYKLSKVEVNGQPVAVSGLSYTMQSVAANATIKATFELVGDGPQPDVPTTHDIKATSGAGGTVSPSGIQKVLHGGSMSFAFIPYAGYEVDEVHVNGAPLDDEAVAKGVHRFDNVVDEGNTIHATFKAKAAEPADPDYYNLTVETGADGTAAPSGTTRVAAGAKQTVYAYPNPGFVVDKVTVTQDGAVTTPEMADGTSFELTMTADTQVMVTFKAGQTPSVDKVTLTSSASAGGSISPLGAVEVAKGGSLTYTVAAEEGYVLDKVTADGKELAAENGGYAVSHATEDMQVRAEFKAEPTAPEEPTYHTVSATAGEGGTISPAGAVRVAAGKAQTFYFYPDSQHELEGVYVDGKKVEPTTANSYTFASVDADASIEARFSELGGGEQPPTPTIYTVTASASTGGTVSPAGVTRVAKGGDLLLTFTPDEGYYLKSVLVGETESIDKVADGTLRFSGVVADHAVRAVFERVPAPTPDPDVTERHTVTASVAGNVGGTVSPSGPTVVAEGSSQTFYFAPEAGKQVASVTVDGTKFDWSGLSYTLTDISKDTTLEVAFADVPDGGKDPVKPETRTVTASVNGTGGTVSPDGVTTVALNGSLTLTFTPEPDYRLASVKVGSDENALSRVSANGTLRLDRIAEDTTVEAAFEPKADEGPSGDDYRTVNVSAGGGGIISPAGDVRVACGADQTFTIVPDEGKHLASLELDGADVTTAVQNGAYVLAGGQDDCTLRAEFADGEPDSGDPQPPARTYTVKAFGSTGGTVSPSGVTTVAANEKLTLTFTPDAGYQLGEVKVNGSPVTVENGVYVLDVTDNMEVYATFDPQPVDPQPAYRTVTASVEGGNGSVSPAGATRVKAGASQTFLFTPADGYVLDRVTVDGQPVAADGYTYTLVNVQQDTEVKVSFRQQNPDVDPDPVVPEPVNVTTTAGAGGSVSPLGTFQAAKGTSPLITITPEAGYQLKSVLVNGEDKKTSVTDGALRLAPLTADVTVAVEFERTAAPEPAPADPVITATAGDHGSISPAGQLRVKSGASQTFSLIPEAGYAVDTVSVDDGAPFAFSGSTYTLFNVVHDTKVHVTFKEEQGAPAPDTFTVSASATAGGEIVPDGDTTVVKGGALSLSFAPYDGYKLYRVTVDAGKDGGKDLSPEEMAKGYYRFANVTQDHAVRAYFAPAGTDPVDPEDPDKPTGYAVIKASVDGQGGSIDPVGEVKVTLGDDKTFRFVPNEGFELDQVLVDGEPVNVTGLTYTFQNVRAAASIVASFKQAETPVPTVYSIEASASSGGRIDPSGTVWVDEGGSKSFAVEPDEGFELAYLLIDDARVEASAVSSGIYTFADVQKNHTIKAVFESVGTEPIEPAYTVVHALSNGNGTISPGGDVRVIKGAGCTFVMLPDEGYKLQDVTVDDTSVMGRVQDGYRLVLDGIDAETTVTATFAPLEGDVPPVLPTVHTVHASSTAGGSISPRNVKVVEGDDVSFMVTPDASYQVAKLIVDDVDVPASQVVNGVFTLKGVHADSSVRAVFEPVPDGPAPEEPPYANVDVQVKVKVTAESTTNGGGMVQPDFISVPRGAQNLPFYVYPEAGYTLEMVSVNDAPVDFYPVTAPALLSLASRASVFAASAPAPASAYQFMVNEANEDLSIEVLFRELAADEQQPEPVTLHRIEARASVGGMIAPDGTSYVHDGGQATFGVRPDAGFKLSSLKVKEGAVEREAKNEVANGLLVLPDVRGDVSISATFEPQGPVEPTYVTVHTSAGQNGKISPSGDVRVAKGGSQEFWFIPDSGYTLDEVFVDGNKQTMTGFSLKLENLQADTVLRATFKPVGGGDPTVPTFHDVSIVSDANGSVSPSGIVQVEDGKSLSLLLTPNAGYEVSSVKVDGVKAPKSEWESGTFVLSDVTGERRVEVAFSKIPTPVPGKVSVTAEAGPNGSIDPNGTFEVTEGSTIDFTLLPDEGYVVDRVLVNGVETSFAGTSFKLFNVSEATTVRVEFREQGGEPPIVTHTITATAGLHGSIVPSGAQTVVHGDDQLFDFQPDEGYVVDAVEVDGARVADPQTSYLFKEVAGDHAIHVTFRAEGSDPVPDKPDYFTITASVAGGHGRISPEGAIPVERGKARTFQFLPDAGYRVSALSIDGDEQPFNGTGYRFVDVQANHAIEVTFSPVTAPAPVTPIDTASRAAQKAVGFVKTGDANGALAVSFVVLAAVAGVAALTARRRTEALNAPRTRGGRGGRR